ncbi:Transposase [Shigella dysenteriae 1617]|uniref:Transposase n=1 Tax=Shigella dysenteriae 1617 TaxID=754093 RepID=A0A0A6ZVS7_SHIDY|nr:Transposase [Shigella dysenteriae 1617]
MSRKGNCYDNAPMESFWGTLKNESLSHYRFNNRDEAITSSERHNLNLRQHLARLGRKSLSFSNRWSCMTKSVGHYLEQ